MTILDTTKLVEPRAFRLADACRLLSVSRSTLYRLVSDEKIKIVKLGKCSRVPASEIEKLIAEGSR